MKIKLALFLVALFGIANTAQAVILYQTGFENPPFVLAPLTVSPVEGQDGWVVGATPEALLSPGAAVISIIKPRQGKQSVLVTGADLVHQDFINQVTGGYYDAIGSYRKPVDFDTGGTKTVRVSAHVRVDGKRTASGNNFFSAGIAARGALPNTTGIGELAISSDGHAYGYSGDDDVPTFQANVPISLGEWHNLAIEANFSTRKYSFFVDDECLGTFKFVPTFTGNILRRGSLTAYAAPDTVSLHKDAYKSQYDQFSIKVVEPEECRVHR